MPRIIKQDNRSRIPKISRRTAIIAATAVIALVAVGFGLWRVLNPEKSSDSPSYSRVCSDELIKRASEKIEANDIEALEGIQKEVTDIKDYEYDQNCLYIIVRYGLLTGNAQKIRDNLDNLKKSYVAGGYSQAFTTTTLEPEAIESAAKFIEERNEVFYKQPDGSATTQGALYDAADKAYEGN